MAVINTGSIVSEIRGSVGDETFARNQGGPYVRSRAGPTTPPTVNQIAVTDAMAALSQAWSATLDDDERDSWRQYASQFPRKNAWGVQTYSNGYTRFIRINFLFYQANSAIRTTTAPTRPPIGPPIGRVWARSSDEVLRFYEPLLPDTPADASYYYYISCGLQQNAGVKFYANPYSIKRSGILSKISWTTGYAWLTSPEDLQIGNVIWAKLIVQDVESHALSPPAYTREIIQ